MLSRTQAGPGRTVKQEQEQIFRNHVQTFISPSVKLPLQKTIQGQLTSCPTFDIDIGGQMSIDAPANGRMEGWMDRAVQKGKDYGTEVIGYLGISYGEITLYLHIPSNQSLLTIASSL